MHHLKEIRNPRIAHASFRGAPKSEIKYVTNLKIPVGS